MRRWQKMYVDSSQSSWFYNKSEMPPGGGVIWVAMPPKLYFIQWLNAASNTLGVALRPNEGANMGSEIENFAVSGGIGRISDFVFNGIPPTHNLFAAYSLKPNSDSQDPTGQAWRIDRRRKKGDRWQPR